ncbi:MAG: hypothetical protein MSIBF_01905 [Candidatus Altiarchaeales archaeon IMC4]|nr:MAG: hypothetical protein MSIBF_01905 [Candidatus Altiarchaeales archaeon IMC4]
MQYAGLAGTIFLEVQGTDSKLVETTMDLAISGIKKEDSVEVKKTERYEVEEEDGVYSTACEVELEGNLHAFFKISLKYTPSSFEIHRPDEITIDLEQAHEILADICLASQQLHSKLISLIKQGRKPMENE